MRRHGSRKGAMRIHETTIETIQFVMPEHANPLGTLFGGKMMHWMTTAGTLAASRVSRGPVVLGSMDNISFLSPVQVGEVVNLRAFVEWIGNSSMEVAIEVESEDPRTGLRKPTTQAHMAFVAIDPHGHPRAFPATIETSNEQEQTKLDQALERKKRRLERMAARRQRGTSASKLRKCSTTHGAESLRIVFPENAVHSSLMFAGDLMESIDEVGGILARRRARTVVVTAAIDAMDFFYPIRVGHVLALRAGLNLVGRSSMEVGVRAEAENPSTGESRHTCSAYLTFVALDGDGKPVALSPFLPTTETEKLRYQAAQRRRELRIRRLQPPPMLSEPNIGRMLHAPAEKLQNPKGPSLGPPRDGPAP